MTPGFGINSDESMYERDLQQPADRFDQCDARHPRTGERCSKEADHPERPDGHSWGRDEMEEPEQRTTIPLEEGIAITRAAIQEDFKREKEGNVEGWASGTRYVVPMRPFIWAMFAEMETNAWKSQDLYRKVDVPTGMGEIFYHVCKLAWLVKHKPEEKSAILEFTADVANGAFMLAAGLGALDAPEPEQETRLGMVGDVEGFYAMFDNMKDWIVEHLGWTEDDMKLHATEGQENVADQLAEAITAKDEDDG